MERKEREVLKFDNYTVILKDRSYVKDLIYGVPALLAN
jgi:sRNA-binding regulator protein Hfq